MRAPQVGDSVIYAMPTGEQRQALITAAWTAVCVNVVYVDSNPKKDDVYGRQITRATSVQLREEGRTAHGNWWAWPDEV